MASAPGALQQQTVLWEGTLQRQQYGELEQDVTFPQPVVVTVIKATPVSTPQPGLQQLVKGFAKDLHVPTAARFQLLFSAAAVPQHGLEERRVDKVFPTQHVWLRGRCLGIKLQLLGYALDDAPQQIQAAAEPRLCKLPEVNPLLTFTHTAQHSQQQTQAPEAAPSLPRPPNKQLPLGKIPPAFVLTLAPLAQFWEQSARRIPLPADSDMPVPADLLACEDMAEAVLAALRGSQATLQAKLSQARNVRGLAVDWDGIRDSVLDMATYCCSAMGDNLHRPIDVSLAAAGVCAAIMLAACQDGAAQLLAWPYGGVGVAGAIAVRDLLSATHQPALWQARSMGLLDLLLESCPAVAGPTLQGTLNPAGIPEPQDVQRQESDAAAAATAAQADADPMQEDPAQINESSAAAGAAAAAAGQPPAHAAAHGDSLRVEASAADAELPDAKRPRLMPDVAQGDLGHACSTTNAAAAAAVSAVAANGAFGPPQLPGQQEIAPAAPDADSDELGGLLQRSSEDDQEPVTRAAGAVGGPHTGLHGTFAADVAMEAPNESDGSNGGRDAGQGVDVLDSEGWDPDQNDGGVGGSVQQEGGTEELQEVGTEEGGSEEQHQQQEGDLDEGDYSEADEDAIAAEAAAKAGRRGVERRPPVTALAKGQLYSALLQLAMTPMQPDAAVSCVSVLRRLRAHQCLDTLQAIAGNWLASKSTFLPLSSQSLCASVKSVAAAVRDLATLVLQPAVSSRSLFMCDVQEGQAGSSSSKNLLLPPQQQADYCVLQLLLSFRALEQLAAVNLYVGAHIARLDAELLPSSLQQAPSSSDEQRTEQHEDAATAEQCAQLSCEHAQLLDAIRALTSALTGSAAGWGFLRSARDGLATLAAAVCPTRQVSVDGGAFHPAASAAYDTQHGCEAERTVLLAAASGICADQHMSAGAELSDSLQRLWLLVVATAELQGAEVVLSGRTRAPGAAERLNAAMKTLFVGGFVSEVGQQSLVAALSACSPAVRQLGLLLEHCTEVLATASSGAQGGGQGRRSYDDTPLDLSASSSLVYGALYAPEILLALVTSPHPDAIAAWLPHTAYLHDIVRNQRYQAPGAAASQAAFPDLLGADPAHQQQGGLPEAVLLQLHGVMLTAHNLQQLWQCRQPWEALGAGSGSRLLQWLHNQLPVLERVVQKSQAYLGPELDAPKVPQPATAAHIAAEAADSMQQLEGAAAVGGVPPPAGKDVRSDAVLEFMRNPACRSAALCALHLINMLLRGVPEAVRAAARTAGPKKPRGNKLPLPGLSAVLSGSDGFERSSETLGFGALHVRDGFDVPEIVREVMQGATREAASEADSSVTVVVKEADMLELLERALRTATAALWSSDGDLVRIVQGGAQQDILAVLEARTAAAALMRAACSTTASLLVHLSDADPQTQLLSTALENESLLDALICAHTAVVTCKEGLQAVIPHAQLSPYLSRATDPGLDPLQATAADAAVSAAASRALNSRVLMLLEARQALAVCLRAWQLQGWWPDPVGALLGVELAGSAAVQSFAEQDEEARKAGDPFAPPAPAPRQGTRQLLASLLALADLCPEEWPQRGASRLAARQRDAQADAAAASGPSAAAASDDGISPFGCPSLILLRQKVADALQVHWGRLEGLIDFGLACETRVARLALVRLLARVAGLGAGMATVLAPKVLLALCGRMSNVQQLRKGLADRLYDIQDLQSPAVTNAQKQELIDAEVNALQLQLRAAGQVCEVLLPLCGSPSIKSVLTEHKAAGVLAKGVYALVRPLADLQQLMADEAAAAAAAGAAATSGPAKETVPRAGPGSALAASEAQHVAGLLLQLVGELLNPDISLNPVADREVREQQDCPSVFTCSITAAWLLAAAPNLHPANMAAVAGLLVGYTPSVGANDTGPMLSSSPAAAAVAGGSSEFASAATQSTKHCLASSAKGRAVLLRSVCHWRVMASCLAEAEQHSRLGRQGAVAPTQQQQATGSGMTQAELKQSAEWAAAALDATQWVGSTSASHAASCAAIAAAVRDLAGVSGSSSSRFSDTAWQEYECVIEAEQQTVLCTTWNRFINAAKAAAATRPSSPDQQCIAALLSAPPLLLTCDASCLDFWRASAAAAARPPLDVQYKHNAAKPSHSASSWWPAPPLVAGSSPSAGCRRGIEEVVRLTQVQEQQRREKLEASRARGDGDDDDGHAGGFVPAVYAARGPQNLKDDQSTRKQSMHVDDYQRKAAARQQNPTAMAPPAPRQPSGLGSAKSSAALAPGAPPLPPLCHMCNEEGHMLRDCPQNVCHHCGEPGHQKMECPNVQCHRCGEMGHLMVDCPGPVQRTRSGPMGGPGGASTLAPGALPLPPLCHMCGEEGHLQRDCPQGIVCGKCGERGHVKKECPTVQCHRCGERGHYMLDCPGPRGGPMGGPGGGMGGPGGGMGGPDLPRGGPGGCMGGPDWPRGGPGRGMGGPDWPRGGPGGGMGGPGGAFVGAVMMDEPEGPEPGAWLGPPPPGGIPSGCLNCGEPGHFVRECPRGPICKNCGCEGHKVFECCERICCYNCYRPGHKVGNCPEPRGSVLPPWKRALEASKGLMPPPPPGERPGPSDRLPPGLQMGPPPPPSSRDRDRAEWRDRDMGPARTTSGVTAPTAPPMLQVHSPLSPNPDSTGGASFPGPPSDPRVLTPVDPRLRLRGLGSGGGGGSGSGAFAGVEPAAAAAAMVSPAGGTAAAVGGPGGRPVGRQSADDDDAALLRGLEDESPDGAGAQGVHEGGDGSGSPEPGSDIMAELDGLLGVDLEEGIGESEGDEDQPYHVTEG